MRIITLEGQTFTHEFRQLGHEVLSIGPSSTCDIQVTSPLSREDFLYVLQSRNFFPDVIFWLDICRTPIVFGIETLPSVTIGYSIDQYCNPWHIPYSAAFDCIFVTQKDYLPLFTASQIVREAEWLPLFYTPGKAFDDNAPRDIPVSFVGTIQGSINPERPRFLHAFKKICPLIIRDDAFQPVFSRSRIVLNQSAAIEINARTFEAQACGAALLTEDIENGLRELYTPGEQILVYPKGDAAAAAKIALAALENGSWQKIAQAGKAETLAKHSLQARAKYILQKAETLLSKPTTWRQQHQQIVKEETARAYAILALDAAIPLPDDLRSFYYAQANSKN